jgi:hypothetical protein
MNKKVAVVFLSLLGMNAFAQNTDKKTHSFEVKRVINAPADKVWEIVGEQYADIANSHPGVVKSEYIGESTAPGEGCERVCFFNENETKYTHEKQINFNREDMTFDVQIFQVDGLPLDPEYSFANYKVVAIDDQTSELIFTNTYRTNPAFMGGLAKSKFKKIIGDYLLSVEHHALTGETITANNIKTIKKQYN